MNNEWENEQDYYQWIDADTGYICQIHRVTDPHCGWLCGYVKLPQGHPLYGTKSYDDVLMNLDVHGGVSFAAYIPEPIYGYYIGFDCAHMGDLAPYNTRLQTSEVKSYKNVSYVTKECESLAKQLKALEGC